MTDIFVLQEALVDKTTRHLGLHNLLCVSTSNADRYWLTRHCCYVFHCLALRTKFNYASIPNKVKLDAVIVNFSFIVGAVQYMYGIACAVYISKLYI